MEAKLVVWYHRPYEHDPEGSHYEECNIYDANEAYGEEYGAEHITNRQPQNAASRDWRFIARVAAAATHEPA